MPNYLNYAEIFSDAIKQKYSRELLSAPLTTENVSFVGAKVIKLPYIMLSGYGFHDRSGGFNRRSVTTCDQFLELSHDRDAEFFVDSMDVDESNQLVTASNLTNVFETEHAIPEIDAFRFSKIYREFSINGGQADSLKLNATNVLDQYDKYMEMMDEAEVPIDGRLLFVTPEVNTYLRKAAAVDRFMNVTDAEGALNRVVRSLDNVRVIVVPKSRMYTEYNFDDGCEPHTSSAKIQMLLIHPSSVIAVNKHSYIKLWPPGTHTEGDGFLYQNRQYGDLFVIQQRVDGIKICAY